MKLSQVLNFLATGVIGTDIAVKVSIDYDGLDPTTATWTNLDFDQWPAGSNYDIVESKASLADYADETITIAFYYKSTIDYAPNWRLVSIVVEEGEAIKTDKINVFYEYSSSSWKPAGSEVYYRITSYNVCYTKLLRKNRMEDRIYRLLEKVILLNNNMIFTVLIG